MPNVVWMVLLCALPDVVSAQTAFEASDGTSSITLQDGGIALVNFSDKSVKLGYSHIVSTSPWRFGGEIKLGAEEGTTVLRSEGGFASPETRASGFLTYLLEPEQGRFSAVWPSVQLSFDQATYTLAESGAAQTISTQDRRFRGVGATVRLDLLGENIVLPGDMLAGAFVGYGNRNNSESLDEVEVCETRATDPASQQVIRSCTDARSGTYQTGAKVQAGADVAWFLRPLRNRIGLNFYGRYDDNRDESKLYPGIGIFVTEAGSPLRLLGGASAERIDDAWQINLQVGIPFK
jgi:hypothetical protein